MKRGLLAALALAASAPAWAVAPHVAVPEQVELENQEREFPYATGLTSRSSVSVVPFYLGKHHSHLVSGGTSVTVIQGKYQQVARHDASTLDLSTPVSTLWRNANDIGLTSASSCPFGDYTGTTSQSAMQWNPWSQLDALGADPGWYIYTYYGKNASNEVTEYPYTVRYFPPTGMGGVMVQVVGEDGQPVAATAVVHRNGAFATAPVGYDWPATQHTVGKVYLDNLAAGKQYYIRCTRSSNNRTYNIAFVAPEPITDPVTNAKVYVRATYKLTIGTDSNTTPEMVNLGNTTGDGTTAAPPSDGGSSYDGPPAESSWWTDMLEDAFVPSEATLNEWRSLGSQIASWGPFGYISSFITAWNGSGTPTAEYRYLVFNFRLYPAQEVPYVLYCDLRPQLPSGEPDYTSGNNHGYYASRRGTAVGTFIDYARNLIGIGIYALFGLMLIKRYSPKPAL